MTNGNGGTDPGGWSGEERRQTVNGSSLERHITTGFATLMTLITGWIGFSMVDLGKEQVKTTTQLSQVRDDMRQLQDQYHRGTTERYTGTEARRDLGILGVQLQKLEDRMDRYDRETRKGQR